MINYILQFSVISECIFHSATTVSTVPFKNLQRFNKTLK